MNMRIASAVLAAGICWNALAASAEEKFTPLFNGQNLDGWIQRGGEAKYTIEGDEIVGTSVPATGNSFLCTDRDYGDFVFEVDFKVDPLLNSGIQIRSLCFDEPTTYTWKDKDEKDQKKVVPAKRVHGYQVEIDPSPRSYSAGIYDEARRGWLVMLDGDSHAAARAAFKQNEWNHFRVEAIGPSIKTYINGVPASDLTDEMTPSGFIALQVHGVGKDEKKVGKQVRWKNPRIYEVKKDAAARSPGGDPWVRYSGTTGPGTGKQVVLISGDEEYRSEEALSQLGKILSQRHGFDCTVLFPVDPSTGIINPNVNDSLPGLEALDNADLMIIATRFRNLPDASMQYIDRYLKSGRPVLGLRTATHAFKIPAGNPWAHYSFNYSGPDSEWTGGFGRLVLGETWVNHHGKHKHEGTRGVIPSEANGQPILRGIEDRDVWASTDVYGIRLPLPEGSVPLLLGEITTRRGNYDDRDLFYGMRPDDPAAPGQQHPLMPIAWIREYQLPGGQSGRAVTTTLGASTDLLNSGVRKFLVNAAYDLTGLADQIPAAGTDAELVGDYSPTRFQAEKNDLWTQRQLKVDSFRLN